MSALRDTLLLPLWLGQVLAGTKSFERNPLIRGRWLNEHGLHTARVVLAHRIAQARRERLAPQVSAEDRAAFARDGFVLKHDFVPPQRFGPLVDEVRRFRTDARYAVQGDTVTRKYPLDARARRELPGLAAVVGSAQWRGLQAYVGATACQPALYVQTILAHAVAGPPDPQTCLHADTFHPTVKSWLFLSDVEGDVPAFVYVPGSHRLTPERLAWERRMSLAAPHAADLHTRQGSFRAEPDDLAAMGLPGAVAFRVKANTLIVADTFGLHGRQPSVRPALRVELWAMGRRRPFWGNRLPALNAPLRLGAASGIYTLHRQATAFDGPPPDLTSNRLRLESQN